MWYIRILEKISQAVKFFGMCIVNHSPDIYIYISELMKSSDVKRRFNNTVVSSLFYLFSARIIESVYVMF